MTWVQIIVLVAVFFVVAGVLLMNVGYRAPDKDKHEDQNMYY